MPTPILLIEPVAVVRDADGYWTHPGALDTESHADMRDWLKAQGLTSSIRSLEDEDDQHPAYVAYYEEDRCGVPDWHPKRPDGDGWFTLSIHDTEEGPVWVWVRRESS